MKPHLTHLRVLLGASLLATVSLRAAEPAATDKSKDESSTTTAEVTTTTTTTTTTTDTKPATPLKKALELDKVEVLGSRIKRADAEGPVPVKIYDRGYIDATGAMTLADFLNYLPQNYTGIGAGRGSAPNELNPEFGKRTETTTPSINFVLGASDSPPGQTGVSGVSLRGLGSGSTLVLVDGRRALQSGAGNRSTDTRQGFVDLNTIPLGLIDHIEVTTTGASALYGADAVAGVINIILKKNYTGSELSGSYKATQHGGGRERTMTLSSSFAKDGFRSTIAVTAYDRQSLKASDRSFSKNQNHSSIIATYDPTTGAPIYGRDLRLNWGTPATVQARTGNLNGVTYNGQPTRFAVANEGNTSSNSLSNFTATGPSSQGSATAIRRGDTSSFLDLVPQSKRYGISGNFNYNISDKLEAHGGFGFTDVRSLFETQPAVVSASASSGFGNVATIVPAAYNPFGQDVLVGYIATDFGSTNQRTHTKSYSAYAGFNGKIGTSWEWDLTYSYQKQIADELNRQFNNLAITAALANPDASLRVNPFIDTRVAGAPHQTALYEAMAVYPGRSSTSSMNAVDFDANGTLIDFWGGPIGLAVGGHYDQSDAGSRSTSYSATVTPVASFSTVYSSQASRAVYGELNIPVFGKPNAVPGIRRLEFQLADRYEAHGAFSTTVPTYGVSWTPVDSLLLRAGYSESYRAPDLTEYQTATTTSLNNTVTDPRRTPATTPGVTIIRGSNPNARPETSHTEYYGVVFEPKQIKGLSLEVNYYRTPQKNVLQSLSAQTIVNNESQFGGRVKRDPADPVVDAPLNQPGKITQVDVTSVNFGEVLNESIDFNASYQLPWQQIGQWRIEGSATHTLKSTRQLAPGAAPIVDDNDTFAPPEWRYTGSVFWYDSPWNASLFYTYISSFKSNLAGNTFTTTYPIPSAYLLDGHVGYTFVNGVYRHYGKGLRLSVGVNNIFDKKPPFSDTVFGYNGGIHSSWVLGRTFEFSFDLPF